MEKLLAAKTAVITGGSRGIGRAIALGMAKNGANIAIIYAGADEAAAETLALAEAARASDTAGFDGVAGTLARAYRCDVSDFSATKEVSAKIAAEFGHIDILVNNAGIVRDSLLLSMSEDDYDAVIDTNLKGAFNMIRHTYAQFIRARKGRIINISSVSGLMGNAGQANYSAAKAGVIGLTKTIAKELAGRGVTCNAIAPGFIKTDMTDALPESAAAKAMEQIPMKRMGLPQEIAHLAVFLASDLAAYITGEVIRVDGGLYI